MRFFGLEPGFQRNELKRRYTRLIKRYKPEKYPNEFQRIRSAYEQLDQKLRDGEANIPRPSTPISPENQKTSPTTEPNTPPNTPPVPPISHASIPDALLEEIGKTPAAEVYQRLVCQSAKTAYDYFALAVLSDLVETDGSKRFLYWLLTGIKHHSREASLLRLVQCLVSTGAFEASKADLLVTISENVRSDSFFQLTETLWHALLSEVPFDEFASLLDQCERNLRDPRIQRRCVFYLQLLRLCVFKANTEWLSRVAVLLQDNPDQIPPYLDLEFEVTMSLVRFRLSQNFAQFATEPLRRKIQDAMVVYCEESDAEGAQRVANFHIDFSQRWHDFAQAFPPDGQDYASAYEAWSWICHDVREKLQVPQSEPDWDQIHETTSEWVSKRHEQDHPTVSSRMLFTIAHLVFILSFFLSGTIAAIVLIVTFNLERHLGISVFLGGILLLVLYKLFVSKRVEAAVGQIMAKRHSKRYHRQWRPSLAKLLSGHRGNFRYMHSIIRGMAEANNAKDFPVIHMLANYVGHDFGLAFYDLTFLFHG